MQLHDARPACGGGGPANLHQVTRPTGLRVRIASRTSARPGDLLHLRARIVDLFDG
jgi:hypothetical protein